MIAMGSKRLIRLVNLIKLEHWMIRVFRRGFEWVIKPFGDALLCPFASESEFRCVRNLAKEVFRIGAPFAHFELDSVDIGDWLHVPCDVIEFDFVIVE